MTSTDAMSSLPILSNEVKALPPSERNICMPYFFASLAARPIADNPLHVIGFDLEHARNGLLGRQRNNEMGFMRSLDDFCAMLAL